MCISGVGHGTAYVEAFGKGVDNELELRSVGWLSFAQSLYGLNQTEGTLACRALTAVFVAKFKEIRTYLVQILLTLFGITLKVRYCLAVFVQHILCVENDVACDANQNGSQTHVNRDEDLAGYGVERQLPEYEYAE